VTERGSTHHSGRVDDELASEVESLVRSGRESHSDDDRLHEPPADDEPMPDARVAGTEHAEDGVLDLDEIEARSRLASSVRPSAFPADRARLLDVANEEHAPPDVLDALGSLPPEIRFVNVQQVWEALGGERERRTAVAAEPVEAAEPTVVREAQPPRPRTTPAPTASTSAASQPWWASAARTGVDLALLPLRIGVRVARVVRERVEETVARR
jgi:hypothetical protein